MKILLQNKKINLKYEILETYTAGVSLLGHEVKSLKTQSASMDGSYVFIDEKDGKFSVILRGLNIPPYQSQNVTADGVNSRPRSLLLQKKEILNIQREMHIKGVTIVPKAIGLENGKVKVQIAVVRGKKKYDKRQDIKKRDQMRDVQRETKTRFS